MSQKGKKTGDQLHVFRLRLCIGFSVYEYIEIEKGSNMSLIQKYMLQKYIKHLTF